jgi:uncharacterized protein (TIGR00369 family)
MTSALEKARQYEKRIKFIEYLGVKTTALDDGHARVELELKPEFTNSFGTAHGGVIMTLLDVALCQAARTQHPDAPGILTIDMATSFIAGGVGRLVADGRVLKPGRTTIFAEAEVRNADGTLVAKAIGTVRARQKEKS